MTKDAIKRVLNSYKQLKAERVQLVEKFEQVREAMYAPGTPSLDGLPRGSKKSDPVGDGVVALQLLAERYEHLMGLIAKKQSEIEDMISPLEPVERMLARFRYIDGLTWEDVCIALNYSWKQTHRIHGRMLNKLVALSGEKSKDDIE